LGRTKKKHVNAADDSGKEEGLSNEKTAWMVCLLYRMSSSGKRWRVKEGVIFKRLWMWAYPDKFQG